MRLNQNIQIPFCKPLHSDVTQNELFECLQINAVRLSLIFHEEQVNKHVEVRETTLGHSENYLLQHCLRLLHHLSKLKIVVQVRLLVPLLFEKLNLYF